MKIVNLKEFRKLPPGTIFAKYEPYCFYNLMYKQDTIESDFFYSQIINNLRASSTDEFHKKCESMQNDNCE